MYPGEVKYVGHVGEGASSSLAPGLSELDRGRLSRASAARRWEGTELLYGALTHEHPMIRRAGAATMNPGSQLCIWQWCLWARPGQQPRLSLPTVALLIPEKRKPWGHLDQASTGRMLPFLYSSGSQSHGINSSEAGSPPRRPGQPPP